MIPKLFNEERGAGLFEYTLLVALIALVSITSVTLVGERANRTIVTVNKELAGTNFLPDKPSFP